MEYEKLPQAIQDIALCYRSLKHNFSGVYSGIAYPGFEPEMLFDELEITPDYDKIHYYIFTLFILLKFLKE